MCFTPCYNFFFNLEYSIFAININIIMARPKQKNYSEIKTYPDGVVDYEKIDKLLVDWSPKGINGEAADKFSVTIATVSMVKNFRSGNLPILEYLVSRALENKAKIEELSSNLNNF